jgi:hypothetical protein
MKGTDVLISERYARRLEEEILAVLGLAAAEEMEVPQAAGRMTAFRDGSTRSVELGREVAGHRAHGRILEEVRDFEAARILGLDLL